MAGSSVGGRGAAVGVQSAADGMLTEIALDFSKLLARVVEEVLELAQ